MVGGWIGGSSQVIVSASTFTPTDLSDLTLWLDATDLTTLFQDAAKSTPVASDGDPVGCWVDKSTNAIELTQSTAAAKPTYKTGIQNGRAAIQVDGGDYLAKASISAFTFADANSTSIYYSIYQDGAATVNYTIYHSHTANTKRIASGATYSDALKWDNGSTADQMSVAQPTGWDDAWHVVENYRSGATGVINVDGTDLDTTGFTVDFADGTDNLKLLGDITGIYHIGYLGELIIARGLDSTDRTNLKNYLINRWG